MPHAIADLCRSYPQIPIFLALGIGYLIGKISIGGFKLGATTGVLLAALVVGQLQVDVPPLLKSISFALFIFAIGYRVGPQAVGGLKKDAVKYVWISLVVAFAGLGTALAVGILFRFDLGTTAGLLGGAMTQSAVIGTAEGAIKHLPISEAQKTTLYGNVAIAYAISYVFGTAGLIVALKMTPRMLRVDLKTEAAKLEREMSGGEEEDAQNPSLFSWYGRVNLRGYRVTHKDVIGKTVADVEALFPGRMAVERIKRGGDVYDPTPGMTIQADDIVALVGERAQFVKVHTWIGPEIDDAGMADILGEILEVCATHRAAVGLTLGELSDRHGHGVFLRRMTRQGQEMPLTKNTKIQKGDVLQVVGAQKDVEKLVGFLGYPERPTQMTDLVTVSLGIIVGTLLGLVAVPVAGVPITLGIGGGVLVSGILFGWLRALHPTFGQIPGPAQWILTDLGLNLFIACVGLQAGARALHALQTAGASILLAGVVVTLTPMIAGILFGRFVLRMNPVLLLGALTGAGTSTAALNALKDQAGSSVLVLGYTLPYAFGNVLLTVWGTVIVNIMHRMG